MRVPYSFQLISDIALKQLAVDFSPDLDDTKVNITIGARFHSPFGARQDVRHAHATRDPFAQQLSHRTHCLLQIEEMALRAEVFHGGSLIGSLVVPLSVRPRLLICSNSRSLTSSSARQPVIDQAGNLTIALVHAPLKVVNTTCFSAYLLLPHASFELELQCGDQL
jgi:hypothetical protein